MRPRTTHHRAIGPDHTAWPDTTPDFLQLRERALRERTLAINTALSALWGRLKIN
ncbi:MAG: hypothetical protein RIC18_03290 [Hoeflea sp.]|uniref:hypothetical protein n=1 Tax=Hoeflea sp. TaxID=1940281 RepID=UPI0032EC6C8A